MSPADQANAWRSKVWVSDMPTMTPEEPPPGRRVITRIRGGRHADLPASPLPGAHEGTAATALTSTSAPGTASPATRTPTTGGAAPANSAAATG
jgi:hypothetical protein